MGGVYTRRELSPARRARAARVEYASRVEFRIRAAEAADARAVAELQVGSYQAAYRDLLPAWWIEQFSVEEQETDWRDLLASPGRSTHLVAEDERELLGYAIVNPNVHTIPGYPAELVALHVRQDYQRRGIGRALTLAAAAAMDESSQQGMMAWVLSANPAARFYERLGARFIASGTETLNEATSVSRKAYGWDQLSDFLAAQRKANPYGYNPQR